jgi:hypothetical protein
VLDEKRQQGKFEYRDAAAMNSDAQSSGVKFKFFFQAPVTERGSMFVGEVLRDGEDAMIDRDRVLLPLKRGETKCWVMYMFKRHWKDNNPRVSFMGDEELARKSDFVIGIQVERTAADKLIFHPYDNGLVYTCSEEHTRQATSAPLAPHSDRGR